VSKTKGMNISRQIKKSLHALHDDTSGAMSVEKILILALIAVPILIVLLLFRQTIVNWFNGQSGQLQP
jgi:Flp pilus assembly pilin Flp